MKGEPGKPRTTSLHQNKKVWILLDLLACQASAPDMAKADSQQEIQLSFTSTDRIYACLNSRKSFIDTTRSTWTINYTITTTDCIIASTHIIDKEHMNTIWNTKNTNKLDPVN